MVDNEVNWVHSVVLIWKRDKKKEKGRKEEIKNIEPRASTE
jgi:hypothetical protein